MKILAVCTTVDDREQARRMARALVERRLAACAEIGEIESFYAWNGGLQNGPEWRVVFKTTPARYGAVEAAIRQLHTYELPAIHAVACDEAFEPYAAWVSDGSSDDPAPAESRNRA